MLQSKQESPRKSIEHNTILSVALLAASWILRLNSCWSCESAPLLLVGVHAVSFNPLKSMTKIMTTLYELAQHWLDQASNLDGVLLYRLRKTDSIRSG